MVMDHYHLRHHRPVGRLLRDRLLNARIYRHTFLN